MFKKVIKVDHKIQSCKILAQFSIGNFLGKIAYSHFCHSVVPDHTNIFKLKKSLDRIMIYKVCNFGRNWDQIAVFSLLG